jgi:hypothetical protein
VYFYLLVVPAKDSDGVRCNNKVEKFFSIVIFHHYAQIAFCFYFLVLHFAHLLGGPVFSASLIYLPKSNIHTAQPIKQRSSIKSQKSLTAQTSEKTIRLKKNLNCQPFCMQRSAISSCHCEAMNSKANTIINKILNSGCLSIEFCDFSCHMILYSSTR